MKRFSLLLSILLMLLVGMGFILGGCSDSDSDDDGGGTNPQGPVPGGSATFTIGAAGGTATYGALTINIPAGALNADTDITVGVPQTEPAYFTPVGQVDQVGYMYYAEPAGLNFNLPVEVILEYAESALGGYPENTMVIWTFDNAGDVIASLTGTAVNTGTNEVSGTTMDFSYFLITVSTESGGDTPPDPPDLASPANGATDQPLSITFSWMVSVGADYYTIQIAEDSDFEMIFYEDSFISSNSEFVTAFVANTTYYWHVMAHNDEGDSDWSDTWHFTVGNGGGGNPDLVGTWAYDHSVFELSNPIPGYSIDIDATGSSTLQFTSGGNFSEMGNMTYTITIVIMGQDPIVIPETIPLDYGGTYTVDGNWLTTTITYDNNDPDNVGAVGTEQFEINGNTLIFVYIDNYGGYEAEAAMYYVKQ